MQSTLRPDGSGDGPEPPEDPRVTVVVASRDRRDDLLRTLGRHRARVILVDNGSTDGTVEAVRRAFPHVEVVELGRNLAAAGRSIGVRRATTPFVAFADDDSWWSPGSLAAAADALASAPAAGLVAVDVLVGAAERRDPFCDVLAASPLEGGGELLPGPRVLGFMACAAMVRRDAFLRAGGFDDVVRFPGEEERLAWDLTAQGAPPAYVAGPVVHHHPSPRRHDAAARRRAVARSRVLTGLLRLPRRDALVRVRQALVEDAATRRGALDAVRDLPGALRQRRVLPRHVLADIAQLDGSAPGAGDRPARGVAGSR
ncbi:glycosyltransferase family 2 protein [Cellulomonas dongxiuzhuiae]|uniref:glycosyltransferase family 2 protein n=1 Tax=Cellulomonas dongxiuzhuiae TaxID=2819979 RepID=UPI001AAFAD54|nr:glycosyltransferase [Cellulomonas dongxiuzhuiae]MBO3087254.1 glycosyltransferase [Cellulomonas dongxiuzhuiae]